MSSNRLVLVTGASRGIGRAIAEKLGAKKHTIIGTATTEAGADKLNYSFSQQKIAGCGMQLDVSDRESMQSLIQGIKEQHGKTPEILVNNAGITCDSLLMRMKEEEWDAVLQTNLTSTFYLSRACLRGMIKAKWGRVINIGSVVASTGNAGQSNYCATKAGLIGFSRSLAKEVGARGVTVNVVSPGFIDTDMTQGLDETQKQSLTANIPLNRLGKPADIASAVAFLASSDADYITGETIHVNGGMYMG